MEHIDAQYQEFRKKEPDRTMAKKTKAKLVPSYYGMFFLIANSSGMGKSRSLSEVLKKRMGIVIALREDPEGFPPADKEVLEYLQLADTAEKCQKKLMCFLTGLFKIWCEDLRALKETHGYNSEELAAVFHGQMERGHKFDAPGSQRMAFLERVLASANESEEAKLRTPRREGEDRRQGEEMTVEPASSGSPDSEHNPVDKGSIRLVTAIRRLTALLSEENSVDGKPRLILAFDECRFLIKDRRVAGNTGTTFNIFEQLRHIIRTLRRESCMFIFLSTETNLDPFYPPPHVDSSGRVQSRELTLLEPFTVFPLPGMPLKKVLTVYDVTTVDFQAKRGFRTREKKGDEDIKAHLEDFAAQKLLCSKEPYGKNLKADEAFAVISHLVPLDIRTDVRIHRPINEQDQSARDFGEKQVAKHLRVLLGITGREQIKTVASSEPLLATGAARILSSMESARPVHLLQQIFDPPAVDKGERGEVIFEFISILARINAVEKKQSPVFSVVEFFDELFDLDDKERKELYDSPPTRDRNVKSNPPAGQSGHVETESSEETAGKDKTKTFKETFQSCCMNFAQCVKVTRDDIHLGESFDPKHFWKYLIRMAFISTKTN
ncbi:hypothetical protein DACRYDRAFT_117337 [Dacryopinax primogenitus]|uniref:Uncharacterized protein n=1 Tax=Dacryopinax primogenitus (strain DJM 731) TaxID=1858805 RepID=M5G953_DACPD|nr:uncharacterized protein DACRYDRAFT_117337 [Dacryopinax primogenitus]EJU00318.1 hypothetical protein DACRYDRAFT_117337 [Dacryopinax primogenitus]